MPRGFRWARTSARLVVGTAVAAGFALGVGALLAAPFPGHRATPVAVEAVPTPSDAVAVCPGPLLAAGRVPEDPTALGTAAAQQVAAVAGDGETPASAPLVGPSASDLPLAYVVPPTGRTAPVLSAAGSASVEAPDVRGFAASACREPLFDAWLVAGSGATGAADLVLIANPGSVAATATVTVYGTDGPATAPGGTDVVVAPGTQTAIPLAGLRLGEDAPVVRVTATGAPVVAALQSSIVRTLLPGGVEQSGAVAAPQQTAVIPGVLVPEGIVAGGEPTSVLRLVAPSADGTATVTLTRADGGPAPAVPAAPLLAGQPLEVDLGALAPGTWTVVVTSDVPVVAGVRQYTGVAENADLAWFEAAPALSGETLAAVAPGPSPVLVIANPVARPATVTVTLDGTPSEIVVPAGGATALPVTGGATVAVDAGAATVHASIAYAAPGALAGYPLQPGDAAASAVLVHP